jgi:hypothetical protein
VQTQAKPNHVKKIILEYDNGEQEIWEEGIALRLNYEGDEPKNMNIQTTKATSQFVFLDLIDAFQKWVQELFQSGGEGLHGKATKNESHSK